MKNEAAARRLAERAATSTPKTKPPEVCGWIMDGDAGLTCDRRETRGTQITGPLCDEHGEEHERESEGR